MQHKNLDLECSLPRKLTTVNQFGFYRFFQKLLHYGENKKWRIAADRAFLRHTIEASRVEAVRAASSEQLFILDI